jgi:hypothetical protein
MREKKNQKANLHTSGSPSLSPLGEREEGSTFFTHPPTQKYPPFPFLSISLS